MSYVTLTDGTKLHFADGEFTNNIITIDENLFQAITISNSFKEKYDSNGNVYYGGISGYGLKSSMGSIHASIGNNITDISTATTGFCVIIFVRIKSSNKVCVVSLGPSQAWINTAWDQAFGLFYNGITIGSTASGGDWHTYPAGTSYSSFVMDATPLSKSRYVLYDYNSSNNLSLVMIKAPSSTGLNISGPIDATGIDFQEDPQPPDPFDPGGTSEPGGGGGTFDDASDLISDSPLPTLSVADTGFCRIFNPTLSQLKSLANYLWTSESFLDTVINHIKQLAENPLEAIIALNIVPCPVPQGGTEEVKVCFVPTGVSMYTATTQFVDVDCGSVNLTEYYGSALDYSPYTEIMCYLPYIGQVTLDTDEVMGRTLQVKYRIDIVSGTCVAKIFVDSNVLYQFSGHCAITMPLNSADFTGYMAAIVGAAKLVAGIAASGASGVAAAAGEDAIETSIESVTVADATQTPLPQSVLPTVMETPEKSTPAKFGETLLPAIANTVGAVTGSKTVVEHSGGFSGNSGYLAVRRPYLIIKRPRMCNPTEYGGYNGFPSMLHLNLGSCSGFTKVQSVQLTGFNATNPELSEISELLKAGVIF